MGPKRAKMPAVPNGLKIANGQTEKLLLAQAESDGLRPRGQAGLSQSFESQRQTEENRAEKQVPSQSSCQKGKRIQVASGQARQVLGILNERCGVLIGWSFSCPCTGVLLRRVGVGGKHKRIRNQIKRQTAGQHPEQPPSGVEVPAKR